MDSWALGAHVLENLAVGRVGSLRGPFRLQIDALLESNLEMTEAFRVTIGFGTLPSADLMHALARAEGVQCPPFQFQVVADRTPFIDDLLNGRAGDILGSVLVEVDRDLDQKILPKRLMAAYKTEDTQDAEEE